MGRSLPDGALIRDPDALDAFSCDESVAAPVRPRGAVVARSVADVQATLRWAWPRGVPVTPRGGR